ncbi:protein of unknown function [Beijerinckiaceae bacterium RH AL1]|nr:protein of unknown function [Beijerinckiaceae bacterium RH AL8]VVC55504.1 protein of unknown function [Beijerinckiaceae bacterium RH AL1]
MTYLTRRYSGIFYVRFRITLFSKRQVLLRFSLDTRDRIAARRLLLTYLSWLIPMQTAVQPGDLFDAILEHGRAMVLAGPARTRDEVNRRARFIKTAWSHRDAWANSDPCPIRDHHAFELQDEVRVLLVMLDTMKIEDMLRLEMAVADPDYIKGRGETIFDLAFDETTGAARAYKPAYLADMYDDGQDADLGLRAGERSIYDIYYNADGTKRAIQAQGGVRATSQPRSPIPATRMVSAVVPSLLPAPPLSATLSQAKKEYLDGLAATHRDGRAEEDAGLVIQFMIDFLGDLSIDRVGRDALHQFEMAMAATPDRTGLPKKAACSPFQRWKYGQEHGLVGLKMLSETRIKNIWHRSLHAWFDWMATKGHPKIDYRFSVVPENPTGSIERDA